MDQLQRFIDLVSKTGDKLVFFDKYNPDKSFVILAINEYEKLLASRSSLLGLTEDELADKINRDIAIWKNEQILGDVNNDGLDWSDEADQEDDEFEDFDPEDEDFEEEELNYLYPEPEVPNIPFVESDSEESLGEAMPVDNEAPDEAPEAEIAGPSNAADFESLADLLDTRFDRSRTNNWSIPSDRKRQAETEDNTRQYEPISF